MKHGKLVATMPTYRERPSGSGAAEKQLRFLLSMTTATRQIALWLEGHQVHTTYDGPEVVEAVRSLQLDAILLDIGLPGLNGCKAALLIRSQPRIKN